MHTGAASATGAHSSSAASNEARAIAVSCSASAAAPLACIKAVTSRRHEARRMGGAERITSNTAPALDMKTIAIVSCAHSHARHQARV